MDPKRQKGLVVYGDIGIDILVRTSSRPDPGQDAKVERITFKPGGSAANCAAVAASLEVPTAFIGFIGEDAFGDLAKSDLSKYGVSTEYLERISGDTGITTSVIEPDGERTLYSYRGVNASGILSDTDFGLFRNKKYFHLTGYSFQDQHSRDNVLKLIEEARKMGVSISLDPSYWYSKIYHKSNPEVLSYTRIIFPNKEEAKLLSGTGDLHTASSTLLEMGPELVVITLGEEGCAVSSKEETFYLAAIPNPDVIDTTGAGDAFCAGFLTGQMIGLSIKESAMIGNITASRIISQSGGHAGAPTMDELMEVLIRKREGELAQKLSGWQKKA